MKIIFALILMSSVGMAADLEIYGPCSTKPIVSVSVNSHNADSVGEITIELLDRKGIPYKGSTQGLNQIFSSPIGLDAMEVLSDVEMRAWGWCYEVDGKSPEVYPDQFFLRPTTKKVTWFFGYAHNLNGKWTGQCLKKSSQMKVSFCQ